MKFRLITFFVFACTPALLIAADAGKYRSSVKSFNDYVKIRYMPSRAAFRKKEPVTELKSESHTIIVLRNGRVMGTNQTVKRIYDRAKLLHDKGITSNQRSFHVSTKKIEISYMGKIVLLEYAGSSKLGKYAQYEKEWLDLYKAVYQYLTKDIASK